MQRESHRPRRWVAMPGAGAIAAALGVVVIGFRYAAPGGSAPASASAAEVSEAPKEEEIADPALREARDQVP